MLLRTATDCGAPHSDKDASQKDTLKNTRAVGLERESNNCTLQALFSLCSQVKTMQHNVTLS